MIFSPQNYHSRSHPKGSLIVCLHGFLGCPDDWRDLAGALSASHRVLMPDLPGHGRNIRGRYRRRYDLDIYAADLASLIKNQCGGKKTILLGYSMGGRIALYTACRYPHLFRALITESAHPGLVSRPEKSRRLKEDQALARRIRHSSMRHFLKEWYNQPLFSSLRRKRHLYTKMMTRRKKNIPREIAYALTKFSLGAQPSLWKRLGKLKLPVLYIAGKEDEKYAKIASKITHVIPRSKARVIKATGHNCHLERPDEYAKIIKKFLKDIDG